MATSEAHTTRGIMPSVNDLVAGMCVFFAYVTRFGIVESGSEGWHMALLVVTTDFLLPLLGACWLLALPTWQLYNRMA